MQLHFENNIFVLSRSPRARPFAFNHLETLGAIHSTKISGNFGPKLKGSVRSNRKSFERVQLLRWTTFPGRNGPHNVNKFNGKVA